MANPPTPNLKNSQYWLHPTDPEIRLFYTTSTPPIPHPKGTILLIHGFPETSHQFRHVLAPLASAGYRVIAPDYRGAGYSSKPVSGYTKAVLAADLHELVTAHLQIREKIHIVGHDIGGMIAHAYAAQFPQDVESVAWGECPLPGSRFYEDTKHTAPLWHFSFHAQTSMAVALVTGRERMYVKSFYDRLAVNPGAFTTADVDFYAAQYSQPGALMAAFTTYAVFEEDAVQNRRWVEERGKVRVRCMALSGEHVFMTERAVEMVGEMYDDVEKGVVEGCGHWLAEENPEDFVRKVLGFVERRSTCP